MAAKHLQTLMTGRTLKQLIDKANCLNQLNQTCLPELFNKTILTSYDMMIMNIETHTLVISVSNAAIGIRLKYQTAHWLKRVNQLIESHATIKTQLKQLGEYPVKAIDWKVRNVAALWNNVPGQQSSR